MHAYKSCVGWRSKSPILQSPSKQPSNEPKKGRGRPRKQPDESKKVPSELKRGRGRPYKQPNEPKKGPTELQRGRGRPQKLVDEFEPGDPPQKKLKLSPKPTEPNDNQVEPASAR